MGRTLATEMAQAIASGVGSLRNLSRQGRQDLSMTHPDEWRRLQGMMSGTDVLTAGDIAVMTTQDWQSYLDSLGVPDRGPISIPQGPTPHQATAEVSPRLMMRTPWETRAAGSIPRTPTVSVMSTPRRDALPHWRVRDLETDSRMRGIDQRIDNYYGSGDPFYRASRLDQYQQERRDQQNRDYQEWVDRSNAIMDPWRSINGKYGSLEDLPRLSTERGMQAPAYLGAARPGAGRLGLAAAEMGHPTPWHGWSSPAESMGMGQRSMNDAIASRGVSDERVRAVGDESDRLLNEMRQMTGGLGGALLGGMTPGEAVWNRRWIPGIFGETAGQSYSPAELFSSDPYKGAPYEPGMVYEGPSDFESQPWGRRAEAFHPNALYSSLANSLYRPDGFGNAYGTNANGGSRDPMADLMWLWQELNRNRMPQEPYYSSIR